MPSSAITPVPPRPVRAIQRAVGVLSRDPDALSSDAAAAERARRRVAPPERPRVRGTLCATGRPRGLVRRIRSSASFLGAARQSNRTSPWVVPRQRLDQLGVGSTLTQQRKERRDEVVVPTAAVAPQSPRLRRHRQQ
jgi:hypothetical protein